MLLNCYICIKLFLLYCYMITLRNRYSNLRFEYNRKMREALCGSSVAHAIPGHGNNCVVGLRGKAEFTGHVEPYVSIHT